MNAPLALSALQPVDLDDKYTLDKGRVFLTGTQALIRLLILQHQRDQLAGLNTAGYVSGYRGSPLGALDQGLWKASKFLDAHHIKFQPGVNEDLAATALWGTQQVNLYPGAKYDGVFGMWYGKGPGVDRSGDVFKHANYAGTSPHGGILALAGDDHAAKSSTVPHQSDHSFAAALIPLLYPSSVQEILDLGLHGWAMSRYSGCWVAFKCVADTVESSASVWVDPERVQIAIPSDFAIPHGGLNIRWPDPFLAAEARVLDYKIYAAQHYARVNQLDRVIFDSPRARFGIVTSGKSYVDVRQALDDLGIDEKLASEIGIRLFKVAMPWPLEPDGIRKFARGLEEILVIEEKRQVIEYQLKEQLYNLDATMRPRIVGKFEDSEWSTPRGAWLLPPHGELTPAMIARAIAKRISRFHTSERMRQRIAFIDAKEEALKHTTIALARTPYFCSGCPHNTSTKVPEGSRAVAGIGCHFMSVWMDRNTSTFTHMGGEGASWIGQAPFSETEHIFANIGDGTYFHSGVLAIRAAIASKVNITYKILYNDAVAMTGGQPHDGIVTPREIAAQMLAEGAKKVTVVTDDPDKYPRDHFPAGVEVHNRTELDAVQRDLREITGTTVLIYDQTCAAEKRRRRKRGTMEDPSRRIFINERVCEGCGDCGVQSNCVSIVPLETEYGRKRAIDQSSCNKDYSCVNGFCPSFVSIEGGTLRKPAKAALDESTALPEPELQSVDEPYGILITGIGGTGVVTIGAILGMAAHLEGKGASVLDMAGLAQKNGAVLSHVRIARDPEEIHASRIAAGDAKLVLACDILVSAGAEAVAKMQQGRTRAVVNTALAMPADFTRKPDLVFPLGSMEREIRDACGSDAVEFIDATSLALGLMGDTIATNLFMVGYAYQKGLLPVSSAAILRAIELNGAAVDANQKSFRWGRLAAIDPVRVKAAAKPAAALPDTQRLSESLDEVVARRVRFLTDYQDAAYAKRYSDLVALVRQTESARIHVSTPQPSIASPWTNQRPTPQPSNALTDAVARYWFKLLAIKDEYEVARLYTDGEFAKAVASQFDGDPKLRFHLAPPLWAKPDPVTGRVDKRMYGPWMMKAFGVLARMRRFRGTWLDLFGRTDERRRERQLIREYAALIDTILTGLAPHNHAIAVELASWPEQIRGYGQVKARNVDAAKTKQAELLEKFRSARPTIAIATIAIARVGDTEANRAA